ncbi:hypothetical protein [Actinomadura sp. HBU206391]|nr:hypothetical protein [Actinomadura sp. HBU206391]
MPNLHMLAGVVIVLAVIYGLMGSRVEFPGQQHRAPAPAHGHAPR